MVQIYIYVFLKIADLGYLCKMEHFVSKLGRLLLFEGISCTCYFTTGFPAKRVSQLVFTYIENYILAENRYCN